METQVTGGDLMVAVRSSAPKLLLDVNEACAALGVGRSFFYEQLVGTGKIRTVRLGRAVRVPLRELERCIAELAAEQQDGA